MKKSKKKINESWDRFSKSKIREIRRNLYEIKNKNSHCIPEIKEIEKNLELEKSIFKPKNYYIDDIKYKGIKDVKNLFDLSTDEDYYKPTVINDGFNSSYIEFEIKKIKTKLSQLKNILIWSDHI